MSHIEFFVGFACVSLINADEFSVARILQIKAPCPKEIQIITFFKYTHVLYMYHSPPKMTYFTPYRVNKTWFDVPIQLFIIIEYISFNITLGQYFFIILQ